MYMYFDMIWSEGWSSASGYVLSCCLEYHPANLPLYLQNISLLRENCVICTVTPKSGSVVCSQVYGILKGNAFREGSMNASDMLFFNSAIVLPS